jgi:hypothetical protein
MQRAHYECGAPVARSQWGADWCGHPPGEAESPQVENSRTVNDPESVGHTVLVRARRRGIQLPLLQPGTPQQHAYIARYNRKVRYDWLSQSLFDTLAEVRAGGTACSGLTTTNARTWRLAELCRQ